MSDRSWTFWCKLCLYSIKTVGATVVYKFCVFSSNITAITLRTEHSTVHFNERTNTIQSISKYSKILYKSHHYMLALLFSLFLSPFLLSLFLLSLFSLFFLDHSLPHHCLQNNELTLWSRSLLALAAGDLHFRNSTDFCIWWRTHTL